MNDELNEKLFKACEAGDLETVKQLVEKGADVSADNDRAFTLADKNGHHSVLVVLMERYKQSKKMKEETDQLAYACDFDGYIELLEKSLSDPTTERTKYLLDRRQTYYCFTFWDKDMDGSRKYYNKKKSSDASFDETFGFQKRLKELIKYATQNGLDDAVKLLQGYKAGKGKI